jgi:hypothetical protein
VGVVGCGQVPAEQVLDIDRQGHLVGTITDAAVSHVEAMIKCDRWVRIGDVAVAVSC